MFRIYVEGIEPIVTENAQMWVENNGTVNIRCMDNTMRTVVVSRHITRLRIQSIPPQGQLDLYEPRYIVDVMVDAGVAESKSEARRLIQQGAVRLNRLAIVGIDHIVFPHSLPATLEVGKTRVAHLRRGVME